MDYLSGDELRQLTPEELGRLQRSLVEFARKHFGDKVLAVGFGPKYIGGVRDPQFPWAARFMVRHKYLPTREKDRIPEQISFRLRRPDGRYVLVPFVTDVQATGGMFVPTAVPLDQPYQVVTGATLRWSGPAGSGTGQTTHWGVLTVGHAFHGVSIPTSVRVGRVVDQPSPTWITGTAIQATRVRQSHDGAIVTCDAADLRLSGLLPRADTQLWLKNAAELMENVRSGAGGVSVRTLDLGSVPLRLQTYLPEYPFDRLGTLNHVLQAEGNAGDFAPGTSGTVWTVDGVPVAMQVGAYHPEYRVGVAQALFTITDDWCPKVLKSRQVSVVHVF